MLHPCLALGTTRSVALLSMLPTMLWGEGPVSIKALCVVPKLPEATSDG